MNDMTVRFTLARESYDKTTSVTPCANWLMKVMDEEEGTSSSKSAKPLMWTRSESEVVKFSGANLDIEFMELWNGPGPGMAGLQMVLVVYSEMQISFL